MPIEDVEYLLQNSSQECTTVFVDSSRRDRTHYPLPSSYVVDLQEPIRNVFGLDILDAVMPNTVYNIDVSNNVLRLGCVGVGGSGSGSEIDANNNAALSCELFKLGHGSALNAMVSDTATTYQIAVLPPGQALPYAAARPTPLLADVITAGTYLALTEQRPVVGVRLQVTNQAVPAGVASVVVAGSTFVPADAGGGAVLAAELARLGSTVPLAIVQSGTNLGPLTTPGLIAAYDLVTYASAPMPGGYTQMQAVRAAKVASLLLTFTSAKLEIGFYTRLAAMQTSLQVAMDESALSGLLAAVSTSASGIDRQGLIQFTCPNTMRLLLCAGDSSGRATIGFDAVADGTRPSSYAALSVGGAKEPMFVSQPLPNSLQQYIVSPGLANLLGAQYVTLRCPEIEQYMSNVGKYGPFSTGVGVFKLLGANEVAQMRFDYVNLIRRPIHPIGRMRRLTLKFETPTGSLYDFKGINHQILLSIKYYAPDPRRELERDKRAIASEHPPGPNPAYVLNPDYDPDFLRFTIRRDAYAGRIADLGFADDEQRHPQDRVGHYLDAGEVEDAEDAADEADDDDMRALESYVYGTSVRRRQPSTADFLRFDAAQQNRVLDVERRLVKPLLEDAGGRYA